MESILLFTADSRIVVCKIYFSIVYPARKHKIDSFTFNSLVVYFQKNETLQKSCSFKSPRLDRQREELPISMTIYSESERDTCDAGRALAGRLLSGGIIALYGDLGAGKTAFVRGLAEGLGVTERVTSPTFTIVNEYLGSIPLFHFDLYRLKSAGELYDLGWDDYLDRNGVIAAEWTENAEDAFPADVIQVRIEKTGEHSRRIDIDIPGEHL
jgi:tRNA threonylcarbamoyladenosine biosynthesis protein TsaE